MTEALMGRRMDGRSYERYTEIISLIFFNPTTTIFIYLSTPQHNF